MKVDHQVPSSFLCGKKPEVDVTATPGGICWQNSYRKLLASRVFVNQWLIIIAEGCNILKVFFKSQDPWDERYFCLHLVVLFMINEMYAGRYIMHGSYGFVPATRVGDSSVTWSCFWPPRGSKWEGTIPPKLTLFEVSVEPEHGPLEKNDSFWSTLFLGSMLCSWRPYHRIYKILDIHVYI